MKPKSTRLNADNRNAFVQAVIEDVLPASKKPQLAAFKARWVAKIYDLTYGPYIKEMNALPKWFFARGTQLKVDMLERKNSYSDSVISFELSTPQLYLNPNTGYRENGNFKTSMPIPKDHLIHKEYKQFLQDTEDYNTKVRELRSQLVKLVSSCNTSKQLYTAWPGAEKYAHCFPYKAPNRHAGATVSGAEIDIGVKVSKASFKLPESNDG